MKNRFHFNPILALAVACTLLWFGFWIVAFEPAPAPTEKVTATRPTASFWPKGAEPIRALHSPTLFAFPSEQGFSGTFPENNVNLKLSFERPKQPDLYLETNLIPRAQPTHPLVNDKITLPQPALPIPTTTQPLSIPQPKGITLFLSPELQARSTDTLELDLSGELPDTIRVELQILPDGTVGQAFFDEPVQNKALLGAIRRLHFAPALDTTTGWLEIRFSERKDS